ncbi:NPS3A protein, partial [Edolisoma coerulescens]|nr:NPS3A protein [Edolisoma coerulescens]
QVCLATGPRQNNGIFCEIRTYDIKPAKMKEFLELANFHFCTAHSELLGFWYRDLGALNKVFHIWKYNFAHRTGVRHALANDKDRQGKLISVVLPMIEKQHNEVAYLVPWCQLGKPPKEGGEAFRAAINAHINTGYTRPSGVFHTEYGLHNSVHALWWNESPDHWAARRHSAHEMP